MNDLDAGLKASTTLRSTFQLPVKLAVSKEISETHVYVSSAPEFSGGLCGRAVGEIKFSDGVQCEFDAVRYAEFVEDAKEVVLDGVFAQVKRIGNFAVHH